MHGVKKKRIEIIILQSITDAICALIVVLKNVNRYEKKITVKK